MALHRLFVMYMQCTWPVLDRHGSGRELLKDDIIPYAIKWFTGEAAESDEEDDDDEDEEYDEDDEVMLQ